jgi:CDP-diacylglycerol--glycerol-3-phosphate 3-phosphatidyltransferase
MIEKLKPLYNTGLKPFARLLARIGIHPDILTAIGLILFGFGGWLTVLGYWKGALIALIVGSLMDGLDGVLARETDRRSTFGAVLDSVCDRFTEIIWIGSIIAFYIKNAVFNEMYVYISFAAVTGSLMVSYVKARSEGAGIECNKGILQRPERLIILALFQLLGPEKMPWGLGIIAVFSYLTVLQRLYLVWKKYKTNKL